MGQPRADIDLGQPSADTDMGQLWDETDMGQPWADTYKSVMTAGRAQGCFFTENMFFYFPKLW